MLPITNTLANEGLVGLKTLDQHRTNRWQTGRPDVQNYIAPMSFVNAGTTIPTSKCQRWPNG